jgi:hypothetical protein
MIRKVEFKIKFVQLSSFYSNISILSEYASVGYMAKRIQMRKNRFLAIQKMAEQKKNEAIHSSNANIHEAVNTDQNVPKQTVSYFANYVKIISKF